MGERFSLNRTALMRGIIAGVAVAALAVAGCSNDSDSPPSATAGGSEYAELSGELKASGASFPNNYYQAALEAFADVAPDLTITYNSTGSGTGKKEFGAGLTDFAGSDSLVKDGDGPAPGSFYYIPTVAAPITVSYNLSEVANLQLGPAALAKIFARTVTKWNDPAIAADNPGVTLPDKEIVVVHRSDGSGTTNNFTKYLVAAGGSDWALGSGDTVNWAPDTQAGEKNTGVAQLIKQSDGAIGYVDFADARASELTFAAIKNKDGNYVKASLEGATAALAGAEIADDLTYDPINAAGPTSYPITAPTYLLVKPQYDGETGPLVKGFITWLLTDGRQYAGPEGYAVLPDGLQQKAVAKLDSVTVG